MKRRFLLLVLLTLIGAGALAEARAQDAQDAAVTAFVDVHVLPMNGEHVEGERVVQNQTVIVRDGRIAEVGPSGEVEVPEGARRIEGAGLYLAPGLAEMHGHIPSPEEAPEFTETVLFLYLANGVTTVRGMQGQPGQLDLRAEANAGAILSPTLYLAGPAFTGNSVGSPEEARQRARAQAEEGWDLLKVLGGMTRDEYDAMAEAAREAGLPFAGHVPQDVGLMHALEQGQATLDHLDGYIAYLDGAEGPVDEARLAEAVQRTREAGVAVVPTMALWETLQGTADLDVLTGYPELQYMPPEQVEGWTQSHAERLQNPDLDEAAARQVIDNRMRLLEALHEGGVLILMGSDAPQQFSVPGFSLRHEVERMAEAGMTPYDILKSGTQSVGAYFADKDDFGTVEAGARADLILLEENPLEDADHLWEQAGVMVRGRWLPADEIQARLQQIAASYDE